MARAFAAEADFAGEWDTTFGRLSLKVDGKSAAGTYVVGGGAVNDLKGEIDGGKLTFSYSEPSVTGEGSFTLSADKQRAIMNHTQSLSLARERSQQSHCDSLPLRQPRQHQTR